MYLGHRTHCFQEGIANVSNIDFVKMGPLPAAAHALPIRYAQHTSPTVSWPRQASLPSAGFEVQFLRAPGPAGPSRAFFAAQESWNLRGQNNMSSVENCVFSHSQSGAIEAGSRISNCFRAGLHTPIVRSKSYGKSHHLHSVLIMSHEQQANNNAKPKAFATLLSNKLYTKKQFKQQCGESLHPQRKPSTTEAFARRHRNGTRHGGL